MPGCPPPPPRRRKRSPKGSSSSTIPSPPSPSSSCGARGPAGNYPPAIRWAAGWHGKRFDGPDTAHLLVMDGRRGQFSLNPAVIPIGTVVRSHALFRKPTVNRVVRRLLPLSATRRPTARLRTVEYRGVPTATMIYDALPINDHFRRINSPATRSQRHGAVHLDSLGMIDFSQPADIVAPQLLGCTFTHAGVTVRLTEVEAYLGAEDPAAHTHRGVTERNQAMFGPGGHLYVYLSYGIHRAGNIVCAPAGVGQGCLLRAGEVIDGVELADERRGGVPSARLAQGPGNLGQALNLQLTDNSSPVTGPDFILHPREEEPEWVRGPRIGISKNQDAPLRFWIPGDKSVSVRRGRPKR